MWTASSSTLAWSLVLTVAVSAQSALRKELESGDPQRVAAAKREVLELAAEKRVDFLRDALWSKVPRVAVWSANNLKHDQVDLREAARVIQLLLPEVHKRVVLGEEELDFDNFRQLLGSSELPRLFRSFPKTGEAPSPGVIVAEIHRQVRATHIPALCELATDRNRRLAERAIEYLMGAIAPRTNQHREAIGLVLLHRIDVEVPPAERKKKRDGYPLVLSKCLANFDRFGVLGTHTTPTHDWLWRWAQDEKAGPADREVLLQLLASEVEPAWSIAVCGLSAIVDESTAKKLRTRYEGTKDNTLRLAILHALSADRLWQASESDPLALGLCWQLHPKKAAARFLDLLCHTDAEKREVALDLCTGDPRAFALAGLRVRPEWFAGLKLRDGKLPGRHLAQVVVHVPGFRRVDVAVRALAQADLKKPKGPQHDLVGFLAFLEVAAPDHLRSLLATWAASDDKHLRNHARELQLRFGDETALNELIAVLERQDLDDRAAAWLARIKSQKVEAFLRRRAASEDPKVAVRHVHALAIHYGLPESVGWERDLQGASDEVFGKARKLVLGKKPIDALVCVLESLGEKERYVRDLGLVRDPRVTSYLERTQRQRHLGLYAWATSQLAIQGSGKAREEFWQGCLLGRYRWIDNSNVRALTLNFDLGTIPFWLGELETNCCRRNSASQIFKQLFGLDLYENNRVFPEGVQASEFWERYRNNLRWSRIKGHYVPGPDR